jgi:hypothetical protein
VRRTLSVGARALGHGAVLALVMPSIVMQMAVAGSDPIRLATIALQAATLVAAVRASRRRAAGGARGGRGGGGGGRHVGASWRHPGIGDRRRKWLLVAVAPLAIGAGLLDELRSTHRVTLATVAGVLAIYLLVGMLFSFVYGVIAAVDAGALYAGEGLRVLLEGVGQVPRVLRQVVHEPHPLLDDGRDEDEPERSG